jgi:hypothetical protein
MYALEHRGDYRHHLRRNLCINTPPKHWIVDVAINALDVVQLDDLVLGR